MDWKKEIVKNLYDLSGKFPPDVIFDDWVKCMAIAIQNACVNEVDETFRSRENQFKAVIEKYDFDINDCFAKMTMFLTRAMENDMEDVLGIVYMKASMGNKNAGQFFTPQAISKLKAKMIASDVVKNYGKYNVYEPTCGSGGIIIEIAKELLKKGRDYINCMDVVAQDLDWRCVYMTYVQLSILGIGAVVAQGDTIEDQYKPGEKYPMQRLFFTPKKMGVLDR